MLQIVSGRSVVAREDVMDTTDDPCMGRTSRCIFQGWDPGSNALLEGLNRKVVPRKDMDKLTLHGERAQVLHTGD